MPTVLSDSDHFSLNSLSSLPHLPPVPPPPPSRQQRPFYHHHSFPSHFHRVYHQSQVRHLPPESINSTNSSVYHRVRGRPDLSGPPATVSTPKTGHKRKARIPRQRYSHGPKWIHRHGLINGINYHWVETTGLDDADGVKPTDKPLVVLLHGFPQFWYTWRHQIVPLGEAGYRVVAPDLRGFNLTDKPAATKRKGASTSSGDDKAETEQHHSGYDMETLTDDIRALIVHLGHTEANIVGHDWGGIIAWAFAARFPQHTTKLVVMNAPHLCRWRDVAMDYSSGSCVQQAWWTCWYTLAIQLLPSWIPECVLSYQRSWILTYDMVSSSSWGSSLLCTQNPIQEDGGLVCATLTPTSTRPKGFPSPGTAGGGCAACWKPTDRDLYRDAISKPGAIYALLEYYRNLWLSVRQMEQYGKISPDLPILVLWGTKDKTFPRETYAQGWEEWIDYDDSRQQQDNQKSSSSSPSVKVSFLDCGHFTPEEAPAEVNQNLLNFFQQPLPMLSEEF